MSRVAIRVERLGKRYAIGRRRSNVTLRDALAQRFSMRRRARPATSAEGARPYIWALKDVSFSVEEGEVLGIIGRNGAGKSTLLKILARVTRPTEGEAHVRGRLGSLLEVGTGFHAELTGRENIYLSGAILGMRKREIDGKFDAIVDFAEVERFVDTPVKHYSSGMYLRLAFGVAAHLEPEILIVDEVLAVGDSRFQQKCLGKIGTVAKQGRTVLFVSHNIPAIQALSTRCMLLEEGRIAHVGEVSSIVHTYLAGVRGAAGTADVDVSSWRDRDGSGAAKIVRLEVLGSGGRPTSHVSFESPVRFRLTCDFPEPMEASFGVLVYSAAEERLLDLRSPHGLGGGLASRKLHGRVVVEAEVDALPLYPGEYLLSLWIADPMAHDEVDSVNYVARLHVTVPDGRGEVRKFGPGWGKFVVESTWRYNG